jgi:hypothetical protein
MADLTGATDTAEITAVSKGGTPISAIAFCKDLPKRNGRHNRDTSVAGLS